jgi:hypothetical protein
VQRVTRKAQAAQFAANVLPTIRDIQTAGFTSLNAIAGAAQRWEGRHRQWWGMETCAGAADIKIGRLPVKDAGLSIAGRTAAPHR